DGSVKPMLSFRNASAPVFKLSMEVLREPVAGEPGHLGKTPARLVCKGLGSRRGDVVRRAGSERAAHRLRGRTSRSQRLRSVEGGIGLGGETGRELSAG